MKSIYFFSTKLRYYLTLIPPIALLIFAIFNNGNSTSPLKLYPLQIALVLIIIFMFLFLFRFVKINMSEVRCVGLFSSKDSAAIKKNRCLVFTLKKHKRIVVEIFSIGEPPLLDWVDPEDYLDAKINIFRAKTIGANRALKKLLSYFDIDKEDFEKIIKADNFEKEYEFISLTSRTTENGKEVSLKFNETL